MFAILQISDIHIRNANNPILLLPDKIVAALRGLQVELDGCIVVVAGDIAYSGTKDEYVLAEAFFRNSYREFSKSSLGFLYR